MILEHCPYTNNIPYADPSSCESSWFHGLGMPNTVNHNITKEHTYMYICKWKKLAYICQINITTNPRWQNIRIWSCKLKKNIYIYTWLYLYKMIFAVHHPLIHSGTIDDLGVNIDHFHWPPNNSSSKNTWIAKWLRCNCYPLVSSGFQNGESIL